MSTDWDVYCLDCDAFLVFADDADGRPIVLSWFGKHGKHRLEYGHLDDECGARFKCGHCFVDSYCKRARGHDGDHANRRDET